MTQSAVSTMTFTVKFTLREPDFYNLIGFGSEFKMINRFLVYGSLVDHAQPDALNQSKPMSTEEIYARAVAVASNFQVVRVSYNSPTEIIAGLAVGGLVLSLAASAAYQSLNVWHRFAQTRADVAEEDARRQAAKYVSEQISELKKRPDVAKKAVDRFNKFGGRRMYGPPPRPQQAPSLLKRIKSAEASATSAILRLDNIEIEDDRKKKH